MANFVP